MELCVSKEEFKKCQCSTVITGHDRRVYMLLPDSTLVKGRTIS